MPRRDTVYVAIFVLVLAPVAAAVVIAALLLFGVNPELVFAPGHFLKRILDAAGVHAANRVGVLATVACWWLVIVIVGLAWSRRRSRPTPDAALRQVRQTAVMSRPRGSRRRYFGTALITVAAVLLLAGIAGLVWSLVMGSLLIIHRSLGPHASTAIALVGLSAFSVAAILSGALLGVVGRRARRSDAG